MDAQMLDAALTVHLKGMRERLDQATAIAKAAETCLNIGNLDKAVEIALDIEPLVHEATTLLDAASLINRIRKE
jgi:hypothetical protein